MRNDYERFQKAGADVAVITMGTVAQTAAFRQRHSLPFVCLADAEQISYAAFYHRKGSLWNLAGPRIWFAALRALFRGGFGMPGKDVKQLQSAFVLDTNREVRYTHFPTKSAEHADHEAMLATIVRLNY